MVAAETARRGHQFSVEKKKGNQPIYLSLHLFTFQLDIYFTA
jgi:hypothetical protein